jgi:F-type H+-transporting ATPase subunit epsilon
MSSLKLTIVTPERTELDESIESVSIPMVDGQLGILRGRAPMIGRLGYGVLTYRNAEGEQKRFLDGGFAEIKDNQVSLLTSRVRTIDQLSRSDAERDLDVALQLPASTLAERTIREVALAKARGQLLATRS